MKIATSDIEANNWIKLVAIGYYNGLEYMVFPSIKLFLDFLITPKNSGTRIYFHNGGRYDFLFLIEELLERGKLQFINKQSGLLLLKFNKSRINLEFADSYAILPASLQKLIEIYSVAEKKIEIDFTKRFTFKNKIMQEHLKNDCISLYKILKQTEAKEGYLSLTVASHALRKFREDFFDGNLWSVTHKFDSYFRTNYYYGGRVEVYKGFGKNLFYYDVNSLYPFVMLNEMPVGYPIRTKKYQRKKIGFYKIKLLTKTKFFISPLIAKTKDGNYYVNGDAGDIFYTMNNELDFLIEHKIKFEVLDGYFFRNGEKIFKKYVDYYYEQKRNASNEVERYIAKLMLNSLYGKFGQKLSGENIEVYNNQKDFKVFDAFNDLILVDRRRHVKYKGVYIAAYITSLARMTHLRLMEQIGFEHIYYCDTDSIICDKKIKVSDEIGALKLEANLKEGIFLLPKTYGYIDEKNKKTVHYKGFNSKEFTYMQLKNLLTGKKKELTQKSERVLGFKEAIRRVNDIKLSAGKYLKLCEQEKVLKSNYTRRVIRSDKKHIFKTLTFYKKDLTI